MESHPATLTPADIQRFERDGYVVVRQAFPLTGHAPSPADRIAAWAGSRLAAFRLPGI